MEESLEKILKEVMHEHYVVWPLNPGKMEPFAAICSCKERVIYSDHFLEQVALKMLKKED